MESGRVERFELICTSIGDRHWSVVDVLLAILSDASRS